MKYAQYNDSGEIIGFFDDSIHTEIPQQSIKISDTQWMDCINNQGMHRIDLKSMQLVNYTPPPPTPSEAAARKIADLSAACETIIVSGFQSAALGEPHTYQSNRDDQLNLAGASATGVDMPYKCADVNDVWAYRLHTAAQLKQVLTDGAAVKLGHLLTFTTKKAQVEVIVADTGLTDDEKRTAIDQVVW